MPCSFNYFGQLHDIKLFKDPANDVVHTVPFSQRQQVFRYVSSSGRGRGGSEERSGRLRACPLSRESRGPSEMKWPGQPLALGLGKEKWWRHALQPQLREKIEIFGKKSPLNVPCTIHTCDVLDVRE